LEQNIACVTYIIVLLDFATFYISSFLSLVDISLYAFGYVGLYYRYN